MDITGAFNRDCKNAVFIEEALVYLGNDVVYICSNNKRLDDSTISIGSKKKATNIYGKWVQSAQHPFTTMLQMLNY